MHYPNENEDKYRSESRMHVKHFVLSFGYMQDLQSEWHFKQTEDILATVPIATQSFTHWLILI